MNRLLLCLMLLFSGCVAPGNYTLGDFVSIKATGAEGQVTAGYYEPVSREWRYQVKFYATGISGYYVWLNDYEIVKQAEVYYDPQSTRKIWSP